MFTDKWFGQANVAFSNTRHAGLDGVLRPGAFDYPVVAKLVGGYRFARRWEIGGRFTFLSGRPYTPYDEAASAAQRRGIYDQGLVNAVRAEAYARLDLRVDRIILSSPGQTAPGLRGRAEHHQPPELLRLLVGPHEQPLALPGTAGHLPADRHGVAVLTRRLTVDS